MKLGGWQSGPKKSSRKEVKEYKMKRRMRLAEFVAKKREEKKEQGREGSNFEESGSRGIREEATEIYSDPVKKRSVFSRYD